MMKIKYAIRRIVRKYGFDIVRYHGEQRVGVDPLADMDRFLEGNRSPVILDVGGNVGQSVLKFKSQFPNPIIHSFEPSPSTFEKLKANCGNYAGVKTWNLGVGSSNTTLAFQENECSDMSSFLSPSEFSWGKILRTTSVEVTTLDTFARDNNINFVHILKSDTQGYDLEVFKGASGLMKENKIGLIYFEFIFSDMYKDLPSFHDLFGYLSDRNFSLVAFYESHFQGDLVSWTDALFINREFNQRRVE